MEEQVKEWLVASRLAHPGAEFESHGLCQSAPPSWMPPVISPLGCFAIVCVFTIPALKINHFSLQPLRINGVKVYTENVDKRQIILDLQIR